MNGRLKLLSRYFESRNFSNLRLLDLLEDQKIVNHLYISDHPSLTALTRRVAGVVSSDGQRQSPFVLEQALQCRSLSRLHGEVSASRDSRNPGVLDGSPVFLFPSDAIERIQCTSTEAAQSKCLIVTLASEPILTLFVPELALRRRYRQILLQRKIERTVSEASSHYCDVLADGAIPAWNWTSLSASARRVSMCISDVKVRCTGQLFAISKSL